MGKRNGRQPSRPLLGLWHVVLTLGVIDSVENAVTSDLMTRIFCIPPDDQVTTEQLTDIVIKFLEEHPEDRHLQGAAIVFAAATDAFPCENQTDEVQ